MSFEDGMEDLDGLMSTIDVEEDVSVAIDAGLSGTDEETPGAEPRDGLSELAAGTEDADDLDEDDDDEAEESDEEEDDESEPEGEALEDDDEDDPESDDEDEPDEAAKELAALKAEIEEEKQRRKVLEQLVLQRQQEEAAKQQQPGQQQPQSLAFDPVFMTAVNALMGGADPEKQKEILGGLPPHVTEAAINRVRERYRAEPYWAMDPVLEFRDKGFAQLVQQQISEAIKPLMERQYKEQARDLLNPYKEIISGDDAREGIARIYDELGSLDQEKRLKLAVETWNARTNGKKVVETSRKLADKDRDLKARKRASRRRGGKGRTKKGKKGLPEMKDFDAAKFAKQIKGMEIDPSEWEDLIT